MQLLAHRLERALEDRRAAAAPGERVTKAALARACGISPASVSDWFTGKTATIEGANLLAAARYLRVDPSWLATGRGNPGIDPQAHAMSLQMGTVFPTVKWETLGLMELPEEFKTHLADDAMAPRLPRGSFVELDRRLAARPGDIVLVKDAAGAFYVRWFRQRRAGEWSAVAENPAFEPLHAERDGLAVVAVLVGEGRSGRLG